MFTGPNIMTNGLILSLDTANTKSYQSGSTTWFDKSGNANNGTLTNGPTFSSANGGSIVFDGVDDYIQISTSPNLTNPLTICTFINTSVITGSTQVIYGPSANGNDNWLSISNNRAQIFATQTSDVNNFSVTGTTVIQANIWYHITGIVNNNVINFLIQLDPLRGYCFDNYGSGGAEKRMYFTAENAGIIDAIREQIEEWRKLSIINSKEFYYLLASVIEAADHVANMSGTYGAYLKIWRSVALKRLSIKRRDIFDNNLVNRSFKEDAEVLIKELSGEILYLDPPYNSRQYAPNFHVLESIAVWDKQSLYGKSGLRNYENQKSQFSIKAKATKSLFDLIDLAQFEYIALSYNNEGLIKHSDLIEFLSSKGKLTIFSTDYRRFRTERNHEKRVYKDLGDRTTEYLFVLKK